MTNVLSVNAGAGGVAAYVEKDIAAGHPDVWLRFDVFVPHATWAAWVTDGYASYFADLLDATTEIGYVDMNPTVPNWTSLSPITTAHTLYDSWHTVDVHLGITQQDAGIDGDPPTLDVATFPAPISIVNGSVGLAFGNVAAQTKYGTKFTPATTGDLAQLNLVLGKNGAPTDNMTIAICADTAGAPGGVLWSTTKAGTSSFAAPTIITIAAGTLTLNAGTAYWLVFGRSGANDPANYEYTETANDFPTGTGAFYNGTTWEAAGARNSITFDLFYQSQPVRKIRLGALLPHAINHPIYFRNVQVGTGGYGSSDLMNEDFSAGAPVIGHFDATAGAVTVIADPTVGITPAHGVLLAFDNFALDAAPYWYSLDSTPGINVTSFDWDRGAPSERDKVVTGVANIYGIDTLGVLDPTNPTSPFYDVANSVTKIDPVVQARLELPDPRDGTWHPVFTGHVANIHYAIAPSGDYATFQIELVDALDILADAEVVPGKAGTTPPTVSQGDVYYASQQVNSRILAALADAALSAGSLEWPSARINVFSGNVAVQGKSYSAKTSILTVIDDAVDAEFAGGVATRFVDRFGVFVFHGRYACFNPTNPAYGIKFYKVGDMAAFNSDPTVIAISNKGFSFARGKDNLINAGQFTPKGIKSVDIPGQFVHDATSILKYSVRSISIEELIVARGDESHPGPFFSAKDEVKEYGTYWVANYAKPQNRPDSLIFESQDPSGPHAATWDILTKLELKDVFTLKTTHPGGGGFNNVDHFVEKISGSCTPGPIPIVSLKVEVSPRAYFAINGFAT